MMPAQPTFTPSLAGTFTTRTTCSNELPARRGSLAGERVGVPDDAGARAVDAGREAQGAAACGPDDRDATRARDGATERAAHTRQRGAAGAEASCVAEPARGAWQVQGDAAAAHTPRKEAPGAAKPPRHAQEQRAQRAGAVVRQADVQRAQDDGPGAVAVRHGRRRGRHAGRPERPFGAAGGPQRRIQRTGQRRRPRPGARDAAVRLRCHAADTDGPDACAADAHKFHAERAGAEHDHEHDHKRDSRAKHTKRSAEKAQESQEGTDSVVRRVVHSTGSDRRGRPRAWRRE